MLPDYHDTGNARNDYDLTELVGLISNRYTRQRLSPPSQLVCSVVKHWVGLSRPEIIAVLDDHFDRFRHEYRSGSGDRCFPMVQAAIQKRLDEKYGRRPVIEPEPEPPRRPRRRQVVRIPTASGTDDLLVDDGQVREPESSVARPPGLPCYEVAGEPIGEDN